MGNEMTVRPFSSLAFAGSLLFAGSAEAADINSPVTPIVEQVETGTGWTFAVAPYFWGAGLSGEIGSFGLPAAQIDADFGDVLNNLDFAAMAMAEARRDRFSIFGDLMYTKISVGSATPSTRFWPRRPSSGTTLRRSCSTTWRWPRCARTG